MTLRDATADEICKAVAKETWLGAAKIYQTGISEQAVNDLFEKWWRNNGGNVMRRVGHKFHEGVEDRNLAPRVPRRDISNG